jgi:FMN phosphatase YigB (HAD superfamily)
MSNIRNNIKFIYFDLGGVLVLDFTGTNKWQEMLDELGVEENIRDNFTDIYKSHKQNILTGEKIEVLCKDIEDKLNFQFPINYDMISDFVGRFEKNPYIQSVTDLGNGRYKTGILTDCYTDMFELIQNRGILPVTTFDIVVDSSKVGVSKPSKEIYKIAEEKTGFASNQILFIDNKIENIESAKEFGWNVYYYNSNNIEQSNQNLIKLFV